MVLKLEEKVGQMLVVGFYGLVPPDYLLDWLEEGKAGAVILFSRNIESPEQVNRLTKMLHQASSKPLMIAIDQEGGSVARLGEEFSESPGAMALGSAGSQELAEEVSSVLGREMRSLGINWNLAPVLDLASDIHNPSIGTRSLGSDPLRVARLGAAELIGFQKMGVAATGKHFPGKAKTPIDPHLELPVVESSLDDLWDTDLMPFRMAINSGLASIMITHVQFKELEPDYPSTLSKIIIEELLRRNLGFRGMVTTDCMEMKAMTDNFGPGESALLAAMAGANMIIFSHTREYQEEAYESLINAVISGRLSVEKVNYSVGKIMDLKERFQWGNPPPLNVIKSKEHHQIMRRAARSGVVLLKNDGLLPLKDESLTVIEFVSKNLDVRPSYFIEEIKKYANNVDYLPLELSSPVEETLQKADEILNISGIVLVATRNAHLIPSQKKAATEILENTEKNTLVCLKNPYDAGELRADAVICTCGDSKPSQIAAVEAIYGVFNPEGSLPVTVS
jgi:beta-N-acetylhexosaminidase